MSDTTEIEKKSLEAHVELCAERYRYLERTIGHLDEKIESQGGVIREVHDLVQRLSEKRSDQLVAWGLAIIGVCVGIIGYLLTTYALK